MRTYSVHNLLTNNPETALTWTDAQILRDRLKNDYIHDRVNDMFPIIIMEENEDGSVKYSRADENGEPIPNSIT